MAPQLWHVGAVRTRAENWSPPGAYDSLSGHSRAEKKFGEPMSEEDIADAIRAFAVRTLSSPPSAPPLHGAVLYRQIDEMIAALIDLRRSAPDEVIRLWAAAQPSGDLLNCD
jgi:hypothetical protein